MVDFGANLPVDPRMIQQIQGNPQMSSEQGSGLMADWGGPQMYQEMAVLPASVRVTYYAVRGGASNSNDISVQTGLTTKEVDSAVNFLTKRGYISAETVTKDSGL